VASVISLLDHKRQTEQPVLILVGLHEVDCSALEQGALGNALHICEKALTSARAARMSVAFVRCLAPNSSISEPRTYPAWLKGFEPTRNDMIFDVTRASCYSNMEFAQAMEYAGGNFTIAGLFGETACLATAIDAHNRRHSFTYLSDASACRNNGAIPAAIFHDAVSQVMSIYGRVMDGAKWSLLLPANRRTL
jgi:nicotinamidase-related amidase